MRFVSTAKMLGGVALAAALAFACTGSPTPPQAGSPAPTATQAPRATAAPAAMPASAPAELRPTGFFLQVLAPADESVVAAARVEVRGLTAPDAVVSVDGQAVDVDDLGSFAATVTLEEGPNAIDVIATDFGGNRRAQVVHLVYVQGGQ